MNAYLQITLICVLTVLAIVLYGTYRCQRPDFHDPLTQRLIPPPFDRYTDGWAFLHFAFYGILAYFFPSIPHLLFIWSVGVLWEIVESIFHDHPFYLSKCHYTLGTDQEAGWWYGRYEDIIMNTLGMALGWFLSRAGTTA